MGKQVLVVGLRIELRVRELAWHLLHLGDNLSSAPPEKTK